MSDSSQSQDFFSQVMASDVVEVRCRRCGSETIMNKQYAKYVKDGTIKDCGKCRNRVLPGGEE